MNYEEKYLRHFRARYELERLKEYDQGVAKTFGPIIEQLPCRNILARRVAYVFVGASFYRRLLLPLVLIDSGFSSTLSMIAALEINLIYISFTLGSPFYNDNKLRRQEVMNELHFLCSIYFLMLFCEQYVQDWDTRNDFGYLTIGIISKPRSV